MKRILYSLLIAAVILPGATAHLQARDRKPKTSKTVQAAEPVRNVILMIGDGMGLAQVTPPTCFAAGHRYRSLAPKASACNRLSPLRAK